MQLVTLEDLGTAYRKAKVDIFYSANSRLSDISRYEESLKANLVSLMNRINGNGADWVSVPEYIGEVSFLGKEIKHHSSNPGPESLRMSDPWAMWGATTPTNEMNATAEYRLMARCSIDFHVLSTVWMMKVGSLLDDRLGQSAYGSRLRRTRDGEINELSMGTFAPYMHPYRKWRDAGMNAMTKALDEGLSVVALTADVTSFYHQLHPSFLADQKFLSDVLGVNLPDSAWELHVLFLKSLTAWLSAHGLRRGLPVGLPASAVVANLALADLDRAIESEIAPLYYGRYVDDIILVMRNSANFRTTEQVWNWIFSRTDGMLSPMTDKSGSRLGVRFSKPYLDQSEIVFQNQKNKIFLLEGTSGKAIVKSIERTVIERSSEWRALPNLPANPRDIATAVVSAVQRDGDAADNLRKADSLSTLRASFAIQLRDFEAYERALEPEVWQEHRHAFYGAIFDSMMALPAFFDLEIYLSRIIKLMMSCKDFEYIARAVFALDRIVDTIRETCAVDVKGAPDIERESVLSGWRQRLMELVWEGVVAAYPGGLTDAERANWDECMGVPPVREVLGEAFDVELVAKLHRELFKRDLAYVPYRFSLLSDELSSARGREMSSQRTGKGWTELLSAQMKDGLNKFYELVPRSRRPGGAVVPGLAFATRPFAPAELFLLADPTEANVEKMRAVMLAFRGFLAEETLPYLDDQQVLRIRTSRSSESVRVALGSWKTQVSSWIAASGGGRDPDVDRYRRINALVTGVTTQSRGTRYLLLPEGSIPARWFIPLARKLHARGISLIAGVEYMQDAGNCVRNQVWAALDHNEYGFDSMMIYCQDKRRPARDEARQLMDLHGKVLAPYTGPTELVVVRHGDFHFALLICSELTNIGYRAELRGRVDALFVPEWNKDTNYFESLVEAAALDMHAYVAQCNDRQYGDSRIRAPYRDAWRRDVVRVKGGLHDFSVVGELEVSSLRRFQSHHVSPGEPFKPVPDGFVMDESRRSAL